MAVGSILIKIGADSTGLKRDLDKSAGIMQSFSQKVVGFASSFGAAFSIGAIGANALRTITGFEQAIADLSAVSGKTASQMKRLTQSAIDIGAKSSFSATEVVALQTELSKLGFSESEILASTQAIGDFSVAVGTTAANAATLAGSVLRSFQLDASQAESVMNTLAIATVKTALDFEKLQIALPYVGTAANQMGISVEKTAALLGLLADRGVRAETAGTSLRDILLDSAKSGLTLDKSLDRVRNSQDKLKTATDIFGKTSASAAVIIATNSSELGTLEKSITGVDGALKEMTDTRLNTVKGKLELLTGAWESFVLSIDNGDGRISKTLKFSLEKITEYIEKLNGTDTTPLKEKLYDVSVGPWIDGLKALKDYLLEAGKAAIFGGKTDKRSSLYSGFGGIEKDKQVASLPTVDGVKDPSGEPSGKKPKAEKPKEISYKVANIDTFKADLADISLSLAKVDNLVKTGLITSFEGVGQKTDIFKGEIQNLINSGVDPLSDRVVSLQTEIRKLNGPEVLDIKPLEKFAQTAKTVAEGMKVSFSDLSANVGTKMVEVGEAINSALVGATVEAGAALGDFLGNLISGDTGALSGFFNNILSIIADFGASLGKQLIALGIASEGFKKLFANPLTAIAAGVGLIAISKIIKNTVSKGVPSLAIGTNYVKNDGLAQLHKGEAVVPAKVVGGGFSGSGGRQELYGRLSGNDIFISNRQAERFRSITG